MIGNGFELMLDVVDPARFSAKGFLNDDKKQTAIVYAEAETDPLRFCDKWGGAGLIRGASWNCVGGSLYCKRFSDLVQGSLGPTVAHCIRLCIGPDLMKERKIKVKAK